MGEIRDARSEVPPQLPPKGVPLESSNGADENTGVDRATSPTRPVRQVDRNDCAASNANDPDPISRRPLKQAYANIPHESANTVSRLPVRPPEGESRQVEPSPLVDAGQLQEKLSESEENTNYALMQLEGEKRDKEDLGRYCQELLNDVDSLKAQVEVLEGQLKDTKVELEDSRSHILSMQPYLKDVTPEEIGRDFDDLLAGVENWVETWMTPVFDDDNSCKEVYNNAQKNVLKVAGLKQMMKGHPDILRITEFPDTNQDAVTAIVMRFLHLEVFSKVLFDTVPNHVDILQQIEDSMRESVEPKRDLFAVRNWRAEAFTSLVSHPEFGSVRDERCKKLTVQLGKVFFILMPHLSSHKDLYISLDTKVIKPAMNLHEKIQTSIHLYWFDLNEYGGLMAGGNDLARALELLDEFDQVDCDDVFNNRRRFNPAKLHSAHDRNEILHQLYPIGTLSPRLMMRQVGRGEIIREPSVVRKQRTLIAWGTHETRVARLEQEQLPTLMNAIYRTKTSRINDGGGFMKQMGLTN